MNIRIASRRSSGNGPPSRSAATRPAFDADSAAARVVQAMRPLAGAARATQEKRYLKSDLDFLGVGVPGIRKVVTEAARDYDSQDRSHDGLDRDSALAWARAHLDQMSGVTFREAVRRLPAAQAARLQGAYAGTYREPAKP